MSIDKDNFNLDNVDFLEHVMNTSVRSLKFIVTAEDKEVKLFKVLIKAFPNLEKIHFQSTDCDDACICFEENSNFYSLKNLIVINASPRSLLNVNAENLEVFEYAPGRTWEYIDDVIGTFFHRHPTIEQLTIGTTTGVSSFYFFVSVNLCCLILNFLRDLKSLAIYNFAEVNKSIKVLCTFPKLKILKIAEAQYELLTKKTVESCKQANFSLISVQVQDPAQSQQQIGI